MMPAKRLESGKWLSELLAGYAEVAAGRDVLVGGITQDSRRVRPGDLFLGCRGLRDDGARYAADAVRAGAVAVVIDSTSVLESEDWPQAVPLLRVPNLGHEAGRIAARFFDHPTRALRVIGVTGTNGKTSVTHFIAQALAGETPGRAKSGVIGTLGYGPYGALLPASHTTPDPVALQAEFARQVALGVRYVAMEVSSHALDQGRAHGVDFEVAVFTNLTRDHLDYHGDIVRYAAAKRRLFEWPGLRRVVINLDDAYGRKLIAKLRPDIELISYTLDPASHAGAGLVAQLAAHDRFGIHLKVQSPWGSGALRASVLGVFNARNLLASLGALLAIGVPLPKALDRLARVEPPPGRLQCLGGTGAAPLVVVDYAHTPDALEQALTALRPLTGGRLWCVFGCGGDRDPGKRPLMGAVAARLADRVVLTNDNPRSEDPERIIAGILGGIAREAAVEVEPDRARAIGLAMAQAGSEDVILIAGKGHEDYQEVGGVRRPYSDIQVVQALLKIRQ